MMLQEIFYMMEERQCASGTQAVEVGLRAPGNAPTLLLFQLQRVIQV